MIVTGILLFSIFVVVVSLLILKRFESLEKAELSTYIVLIAWGSLLYGLFVAKIYH
jgi:hypothetical protein